MGNCSKGTEPILKYSQGQKGEPRDESTLAEVPSRQNRNLAPRPAAWFTVLYDLMLMWDRVDLPSRYGRDEPVSILSEPLGWASFHKRVPPGTYQLGRGRAGFCRRHTKDGESSPCFETPWPVPTWLALRQYDILGFEWNETLKRFDDIAKEDPGSKGDCNPVAWLPITG